MAEIQFDKHVVDDGESPGIPETVRQKTQYLLQSTRRITVEHRNKGGKFAKCNGFRLTQVDDNDDYPKEEVEEVCEAIMRLVNAQYRELEAGDDSIGGVDFRIVFDRRPNGKRERPSIDLPDYSPDGPDLPLGHGMSFPDRESHATEIMTGTMEQLGGLVDKLAVRIDGLMQHIVHMSNQHKDMYEPLVKMMAIANQNSVLGMEMQRRALEYIYSTKRIEEEEAGKDRRAEKWMEWLKKPADTAVKQFGRYMTAKATSKNANGRTAEDEDEDEDEDDVEDEPAGQSAAQSGGETQARYEMTDTMKQNPVATFAQALGRLLEPAQYAKASGILTKKEMALFTNLLEQETDEEVVAVYDKIEDGGIPMRKLMMLNSILDNQQGKALKQLFALVERHREGWDTGESKD